jgi:hypothetical protein
MLQNTVNSSRFSDYHGEMKRVLLDDFVEGTHRQFHESKERQIIRKFLTS